MLAGDSLFLEDIALALHVALMIVMFDAFPLDMIEQGKYSGEIFEDGAFFFRSLFALS